MRHLRDIWLLTRKGSLKSLERCLLTTAGEAVALTLMDGAVSRVIRAPGAYLCPKAGNRLVIGATEDPGREDLAVEPVAIAGLKHNAERAAPVVAGATELERWAGLRPRSRSRAPMLGLHPMRAGAYIANGGFKIGFGMAPKAAELMADLVLDGRDSIPQDFKPEASL